MSAAARAASSPSFAVCVAGEPRSALSLPVLLSFRRRILSVIKAADSMRSQLVCVRNDDMNVGRERRPDLIWRGEEDDSGSHVAPSRVASRVGGAY